MNFYLVVQDSLIGKNLLCCDITNNNIYSYCEFAHLYTRGQSEQVQQRSQGKGSVTQWWANWHVTSPCFTVSYLLVGLILASGVD